MTDQMPPPPPPPTPADGGGGQPGFMKRSWTRFRGWPTWAQITTVVVLLIVIVAAGSGGGDDEPVASSDKAATSTIDEQEEATTTTEKVATTSTTTSTTTTTTAPPPPDPIVISGAGDDVPSVSIPFPAVAHITHSGGSNFSVITYNGPTYGDLLVNETGKYDGTAIIADWDSIDSLEITADGPWTIEFIPIEALPVADLAAGISGSGDAVIVVPGDSDRVRATHDGSSNFAIIGYTSSVNYEGLMVNETGAYDGVIRVEGTVLAITADGNWTLGTP